MLTSVGLFASLFLTKQALTLKNKLQLIKHFETHSANEDAKQEAENPSKLLKIALTCLSLVKGNVERAEDTSRGYSLSPLDSQVLEKILKITNNLMKSQETCPSL